MGEAVRTAVKAPETKKGNPVSQVQKGNFNQPISSPVEQILFLQRTIGNQAVQKLMKTAALQAKFRINALGDVYEQEADRVAQKVMGLSDPKIQQGGFQQSNRSMQLSGSGQSMIMRDIFQPPAAECSVSERHSTEIPSSTCCTLPMLREIWNLRAQAIPVVWNAFRKLMNPNDVRSELWAHFKIRPDDRFRVVRVTNMFSNILNAMVSDDVLFMCRDGGDPACRGRRAASDNCSSTSPRRIWFCGDIAFFPPFLFGSNWLRTMIHEYVHTGCPAAGQIFGEGNEFYIGRPGYPPDPDLAVKNADSYANFALSVR